MKYSRLYTGSVYHSRLYPLKHTFQYDVYYCIIDLDELESGELDSALFGHNHYRPIAIWDRDYLDKDDLTTPIKQKLLNVLKKNNTLYNSNNNKNNNNNQNNNIMIKDIKRVELVTMARYMNKSFNPVNFYYCYGGNKGEVEEIVQVVVEINNTFGETHLYFPNDSIFKDTDLKYKFGVSVDGEPYAKYYSSQKEFHVSPFNSLDGSYDFCFSDIRKCFDIRVNLLSNVEAPVLDARNDQPTDYIIMTRLWSKSDTSGSFEGLPMTTTNLAKVIVRFPITSFLTFPRILYQAGKLHWQRGLGVYAKPNPPPLNTPTIIAPSSSQLEAMKYSLQLFKSFQKGHFILNLPDHQSIDINLNNSNNKKDKTPIAENLYTTVVLKPIIIKVNNYDFFTKIYIYHYNNVKNDHYSSGISAKALGISYMVNDFECQNENDLPILISLLCDLTTSQPLRFNNLNNNSNNNNNSNWGFLKDPISNRQQLFNYFLNNNNYSFMEFNNIYNRIELKKKKRILVDEGYPYLFSRGLQELYPDLIIDLVKDDKMNGLYDGFISIESNSSNQLINYQEMVKKGGLVITQTLTGPYHPYSASDIKPRRFDQITMGQKWARYRSDLESKYWSLFTNFQHDPFQSESRYQELMLILAKGNINGHIYDVHVDHLQQKQQQLIDNSLELMEMENLGDEYSETIEKWIENLKNSLPLIQNTVQTLAINAGCQLKINHSDIMELYNCIYFHLSYLLACFKSVWILQRFVYTKK